MPSSPHITRGRRRSRRLEGFTLLEMMIALTIGSLVIATVYTIGSSAARHFHEQQRISQLQLSVRLALDRIRRDVQRAAFQGTANSATDPTCGPPPPTQIRGFQLLDNAGAAAFAGQPGFVAGSGQADTIVVSGNFRTGDTYLVRSWTTTSMRLATYWQGYRRSFTADPTTNNIDAALVQTTFAPGTPLLVRGGGGTRIWTASAGIVADGAGLSATVSTSSAYPDVACRERGNDAECRGCTVSPVSTVTYSIVNAAPPLGPATPVARQVNGPNTVLMRTETNPFTGAILDGPTPILEYAVHFDVDALVNVALVGTPTQIQMQNDAVAALTTLAQPQNVRGVRISLAARTPGQDPHLSEQLAPLGDGTPRVFDVFGRGPGTGAARVRSAYTEVFMPNMQPE
jgi:prepilin-type N-terminal cleavage/methylation domain-containing protein